MPVDIILSLQHFGSRRRRPPEQRLMIAVLQDALECVEKYRLANDSHGRRLFDEAKRWMLAEDAGGAYSFESICAVLDLDSDAVRQRLRVAPLGRPSGSRATSDGRRQTGIRKLLRSGTNSDRRRSAETNGKER